MENLNISVEDKVNFVNYGKTSFDTKEFFKDYDYRKDPIWKDDYTSSKIFSKDIKKVTELMDKIKDTLNVMNTLIWGEEELNELLGLLEKFFNKTDRVSNKLCEDFHRV